MAVPSSFKASIVRESRAKLIITERSLPRLEPGEVAVKVKSSAVNPIDWKARDYNYFINSHPTILGTDGSGEIAAIGPKVNDFKIGERVFFQGILGGLDSSTFQQYAKMPSYLVAKTPQNISDDEAAGIAVAFFGAAIALYDTSGRGLPAPWTDGGDRVGKGKSIVILGGASSVGQYAIQLARLSGFDRIVTNANSAHHEALTSLGAHVVLDRHIAALQDYVSALGDYPLDFVFDAVAFKESQRLSIEILRATKTFNSQVIMMLSPEQGIAAFSQAEEPKVILKVPIGASSIPRLKYLVEPAIKWLGGEDGVIAKGLFVPNPISIVKGGLNGLEEALAKSKQGVSRAKLIIHPFEA